ncbi:integrative conjugal element protein, partial [Mycoplasmopsis pullorum]
MEQSVFKYFVDELNRIEKEFRTITRKIDHPDWRVYRTKSRCLLDEFGNKYYYNITQYYTIKEVDGKKKRRYFKYYH